MMQKGNYLFIVLLIILAGCETEIREINLPEFRQKLVVTGFLSPDDSVSFINVSSNSSLFGDLSIKKSAGNITGYINDGSGEIMLDTFITGLKLDHRKMRISPGGTYRLRVVSDAGLTAEATSKVPAERAFSIEADTTSIETGNHFAVEKRRIIMRIAVQDIAGEENYYRIKAKAYGYYTVMENNETMQYFQEFTMENENFTDQGLDGTKIIRLTDQSMKHFFELDSSFAVIHLFHTEKPYYLYHKSLQAYDYGKGPFAEPTPVYSNVEGGLGVFTSYTADSVIVRLK